MSPAKKLGSSDQKSVRVRRRISSVLSSMGSAKPDNLSSKKHRYTRLQDNPLQLAQRIALLAAFSGKDGEEIFDAKLSAMTLDHVHNLWASLISKLSSHENMWPWSSKKAAYVSRCPPLFSVSDTGKLWTCRLAQWCPFCWCRDNVVPSYQRLERAVFKDDKPLNCTLVDLTMHSYLDMSYWSWVRNKVCEPLDQVIDGSIGCVHATTVEPFGTDHHYKHRMIAIMPPGSKIPQSSADMVVNVNTGLLTQMTLAAATGRALQYPTGLLTGSFKSVLDIIRLRYSDGRAPRMIRTFGVLRSKTK